MSKLEEQLEELVQEELIEDDEVENPWIVNEENLSDEEKMIKLKDLAKYATSEEFKALKAKYKAKLNETKEAIRTLAYSREECKATKSCLDEYVMVVGVTKEIAEDVTNQTFKDYLLKARVVSYDSAIINKKGFVIRGQSEVPFDVPLFTDLDLLKEKCAVYNSVERFLQYLISVYDVKRIMENLKKAKEKPADNPNQPY